jgi:hypothetical protein
MKIVSKIEKGTLVYAGIGSRKTPEPVLSLMKDVALALQAEGWTLRSGGASGADSKFEEGAGPLKQIFLPWQGFNSKYSAVGGNDGYLVSSRQQGWQGALETVSKYHPRPENLGEQGTLLMARNAMQILGPDLKSPSKFVICWTPGGKEVGGTSQAIRIAKDFSIPIYNLGKEKWLRKVTNFMKTGEEFCENFH